MINVDRPLVQRDDDKAEVIQKRLQVYHQQTEPLVKYYEAAGKLKSIDATQSPEQVSLSLEKAFSLNYSYDYPEITSRIRPHAQGRLYYGPDPRRDGSNG